MRLVKRTEGASRSLLVFVTTLKLCEVVGGGVIAMDCSEPLHVHLEYVLLDHVELVRQLGKYFPAHPAEHWDRQLVLHLGGQGVLVNWDPKEPPH